MKKKNPTLQQNRKKKLLTHEKHVDIIFFIEKKIINVLNAYLFASFLKIVAKKTNDKYLLDVIPYI